MYSTEPRPIKYFLYARKSSESDDRQVQSIDDQINRLQQLAIDLRLNVIHVYTEAKSAKKPDNRPIFTEMLRRIEHGEADGILCWQINRLSRNPIDSASLIWLLQRGILQSIQTIDRQYLPDDNVLLFSVESGSANQFILDLRKNVKRGIESKLQKGWAPNIAPLGYLNDKLTKTIIKDPERFSLVRKMWDLMLTGSYTPPGILTIATNSWGLRTRVWHKKGYGNNPIARSAIYKMFTNPFYAGMILYFGMLYQGKHEAMVTMDEFERVQVILGKKHSSRPKQKKFSFTGVIHCAECGCLYTAEIKKKKLKSGQIKEYTYYHCTRKSRKVKCSQKRVIREDKLELMIEKEILKFTISPRFLSWALEGLRQRNDQEIETRAKLYETLHTTLVNTQNELDELTKMRYKQLINDEIFTKEHNKLQDSILRLESQLRETESRAKKWLELTEQTFLFATYARQFFLSGGLELKKEILLALGGTPLIKGETLIVTPHEWLKPIQKDYSLLDNESQRLEPKNMPVNIDRNEALLPIRTRWLSTVDNVITIFEQLNDTAIYIPKLSELKNV